MTTISKSGEISYDISRRIRKIFRYSPVYESMAETKFSVQSSALANGAQSSKASEYCHANVPDRLWYSNEQRVDT